MIAGVLGCAAASSRADLVLNSFESTSSTAFYDWTRLPSKTPECPVIGSCAIGGGPCSSAYQTAALFTEGSAAAKIYLQPFDDGGGIPYNCDNSKSCQQEPFRSLTLYNFSPRDWSGLISRLAIDARRGLAASPLMNVAIRVRDGSGNMATSSSSNLTATSTGSWQTVSFAITAMATAGVDITNIQSVCIILPLPSACNTLYLDNLRLVPGWPPCPPLAVSAVATGVMGQIRLGWTISCEGSDPTVSYRVYRSTAAIVTLPGTPTATVATGFLDSGLVNGTRYHYRVVAVDAQGALSTVGDPGDDDSDVPWGCLAPAAMTTVSATAIGSSVNLSWMSPAQTSATVMQYLVLRGTFSGPPAGMTVIATVPHTGYGYYATTDSAVSPGGTYCYAIQPVETGGCSSTSPVVCRTVPCNLSPPAALSGLGFCDRIRLSWGAISATEYRIYRSSIGAACGGMLVAQPPPGVLAWDDLAVVNGVTYNYTITAWSPTCESVCATQQSVVFDNTAPCPPCIPPGAVAAPGMSAGSRRVTVSWTRPVAGGSPISRYFVWLGAGATGSIAGKSISATVWDQPGGPGFTATITGLLLDTQYCAIIETVDDGSPSCTSFSGESCATTACVTPPVPVITSVAPVAAGALAVTWPRPVATGEPLSTWMVLRATVAGGPVVVAGTVFDAPVAGFTFTDTGLAAPLEYCYRLKETDAAGCTVWSAEVCSACVPPGPPTGLTAQAATPAAIALSWIPATAGALGVSRYEVFRASFSGTVKPLIGTAWGPVAAGYTDSPVNAFLPWYYALRAVDEAGCSTWSAERPYVYQPPGPAAPVTVTALLTAAGMHLEWAPPVSGSVNLTAYVVWRASTATGPVLVAGTVWHDPVATRFTFTDSGVALNRDWVYRIQVLDAVGGTAWSGPFGYSPNPPRWTANDALPQFAQAGATLWLDWDAATPGWLAVSRYLVYRSTNSATCAGPLTLTGTVWDDGLSPRFSATDTGLNPSAQYGYRFLAIDLGGSTGFSVCASSSPCLPPAWTNNASGLAAQPLTGAASALVWWTATATGGPGNPVSGYVVYRSTVAGCAAGAPVAAFAHNDATVVYSWTDTGLAASTPYWYAVAAVSANGCGAAAPECVAITTPGTCSFTVQPAATVQPGPTGRPSIRISWGVTATGTPGTISIWRGESATGGTTGKVVVATPNMLDGAWLDTGVVAGRTYCYVLTLGVPSIACSATSLESCGQTAALLVTVYPNPAEPSKGPIRFDGLPDGSVVEIYTVNGDRVIASPAGSAPLWLWDGRTAAGSPAAPGIYLYLIRGSGSPVRGTLVLGK